MNWVSSLCICRGVTAIIGSGGKTTLMYALAQELSYSAKVLVCTTTHIFPPEHIPVLMAPTEEEIGAAFEQNAVLCVSAGMERGKLLPPALSFACLRTLADYVLVEADGSHGLPAKAHAPHEPVVPEEAGQTICVFGLSALGRPIEAAAHRPGLYAEKLGTTPGTILTPELAARLLRLEGLHTRVLLNQSDLPDGKAKAQKMAEYLACPGCIGSLQKGTIECLF